VHENSGARRVYTALSTLRKLGMRDVLRRSDDGFALHPGVVVVCDGDDED
jgi:hypothetical protein